MNQVRPFYSTISICLTSLETESLRRIQTYNERKYITQRGENICFSTKGGRREGQVGEEGKDTVRIQSSLAALRHPGATVNLVFFFNSFREKTVTILQPARPRFLFQLNYYLYLAIQSLRIFLKLSELQCLHPPVLTSIHRGRSLISHTLTLLHFDTLSLALTPTPIFLLPLPKTFHYAL